MTGVLESSDSQKEHSSVHSYVERLLPFIPDELDDYGLTGTEFRIYGHVVRIVASEGSCVESVMNIAKTCLLSENATIKALNTLTEVHKLLYRNERVGEADEYTLADQSEWTPPVPPKDRLLNEMKRKRKKSNKARNSNLDSLMSKSKGFGS